MKKTEPRQIIDQVGHDPLQAAESQSNSFNTLWLKNGEAMTLTQRIGCLMFSLLFFACGLFAGQSSVIEIRGADGTSWFFGVFFALVSLFFLVFGVLGLRNVLRFKR
jgi:hypothetical protein